MAGKLHWPASALWYGGPLFLLPSGLTPWNAAFTAVPVASHLPFPLRFRACPKASHLESNYAMKCRPNCGACCIAPSLSSQIPGMLDGKPAGQRCIQLSLDNRCKIFGQSDRPACCAGLQASIEMCGSSREDALTWLTQLEEATQPR